jgi:hypothetical protein
LGINVGRGCVQEGGYVRTTRYPQLIRKAVGLLILLQILCLEHASSGTDELEYISKV